MNLSGAQDGNYVGLQLSLYSLKLQFPGGSTPFRLPFSAPRYCALKLNFSLTAKIENTFFDRLDRLGLQTRENDKKRNESKLKRHHLKMMDRESYQHES